MRGLKRVISRRLTLTQNCKSWCRDALAGDRLLILYDYPVDDVVDDTAGEDAASESDSDSSDGDWDEKNSEYDQEESENDYEYTVDDSGGVERVGQKDTCALCKITGRRKFPSRTASQGTQSEPTDRPSTSEVGNKCGSCGVTDHNQRKCPFIEPAEGVVDLGSNADDLFDTVNLTANTVSSIRKLVDPDESNCEETGLHENIVAISLRPMDCVSYCDLSSLSHPIKFSKNVQMKKEITKGKQQGPENEELDFMFLDDPVFQVKQLRGRTISVVQPNQINNTKFQEIFGDVVPQQYKISYSYKIAQLKNVKKVTIQSKMAAQMHKPDGEIDWASQAVCDSIAEQTTKAIIRTNEKYEIYGLKLPPSSTDDMFSIDSTQAKPSAYMAAKLIATTTEMYEMYGPHVKLKDIGKPKPMLKYLKTEK
ncbi:OLC1v1031455C1 [Oldenlandia corymbosa var. corymbosa]|uniref:OLC1v1031455C1 n=1 Tax=Oldenlandia corymbosa var. corymbosa TaxID=529605 RepID=A0AAV1CJC0_OLDCO|nr:OLC1v1031455C1 [Oldenlandia corymbosa var. corymbosa]